MKLVEISIKQPITVVVFVVLVLLAGVVSINRVPIQLTPEVEETVIAVTTTWENASPQEIESEIVDEQEERLQSVENLESITSISQSGQGQIRLEFRTGTDKAEALREVSDKLREVPSYPFNVDEPVVLDSDPESQDYIAWIIMKTTDPDFDVSTLYTFIDNRVKPRFERLPGVSEVGIYGGREREVQIRVDPVRLAQHEITIAQFIDMIQATNDNVSGGALADSKYDIRLRAVGRFNNVAQVEDTVIKKSAMGPVYVRDVAEVVETYKEKQSIVRSKSENVIAINFQRELGTNVIEVMDGIKAEIANLNREDGLLANYARSHGVNGELFLEMSYDQTKYIDQAIGLVKDNIYLGGALATLTLLLFLRSLRSIGIIAIAIPISVIGSVVSMVMMGRTVNVVSLAGMAFAVGMVVDNAIVVLENIYRHLEMKKGLVQSAYEGTSEVAGAVLASTLTTLVVFIPVLLIEETAGQLFRDIALAICASVGLSFIVSITVIPCASSRLLSQRAFERDHDSGARKRTVAGSILSVLLAPFRLFLFVPVVISRTVQYLTQGVLVRGTVLALIVFGTLFGIYLLLPPLDYLPQGNRNIVFGLLIPPPGYHVDKLSEVGERIEERISPFWRAYDGYKGSDKVDTTVLPALPADFMPGSPMVTPPPLDNYFMVVYNGRMFHGAISGDDKRVIDLVPLFNYATNDEVTPGMIAFAFQLPLFQVAGSTGAAVKVDLVGNDLSKVRAGAGALLGAVIEKFGPYSVQPEPSNFNIPSPELRVTPNTYYLADVGLTARDIGLTVQVNGDGAFVGDYEKEGDLIDLSIISKDSIHSKTMDNFGQIPVATPDGSVVPLASLASIHRVVEPDEIKRVGRQRAVTLQVTPPPGVPLQAAIDMLRESIGTLTQQQVIPPEVDVNLSGSASKLDAIRYALLGDGSFTGTVSSSMFLALLVVYLLMCMLFQSWVYPLVIMVSVPLATFGGFLALSIVHYWSTYSRYLPVQNLDVLTILGFVILAGVVVNNAILIVHQTLNFMSGRSQLQGSVEKPTVKEAIVQSVESRIRPILMSTLTSVGGMLPLVLMPGSGSELYRGLGSVVVGGLLVSTLFTLILVPIVLSIVFDIKAMIGSPVEKPEVELQPAPNVLG